MINYEDISDEAKRDPISLYIEDIIIAFKRQYKQYLSNSMKTNQYLPNIDALEHLNSNIKCDMHPVRSSFWRVSFNEVELGIVKYICTSSFKYLIDDDGYSIWDTNQIITHDVLVIESYMKTHVEKKEISGFSTSFYATFGHFIWKMIEHFKTSHKLRLLEKVLFEIK